MNTEVSPRQAQNVPSSASRRPVAGRDDLWHGFLAFFIPALTSAQPRAIDYRIGGGSVTTILSPEGYTRWLSDEPDPRDLMRPFRLD
jgi:hypothetical protein